MTSYDKLPYPILAHSQTHPVWLATLARLHGVEPAPVERCRVLEIGCASGGNLIPMACHLNESEFVGIDASGRQIAQGRDFIRSLGLKNIRLEPMDLLDFDESRLGAFDYLIAHGLYSWVPDAVRDKLLDICRTHLAATGVAFISFNAYPGWKARSMVRDLMLYRARQAGDPLAKARQARELLDAVVQALSTVMPSWDETGSAHAYFYKEVADGIKELGLSYTAHEFFDDVNSPVYFHEFADLASRNRLQYLADINFRYTLDINLPPAIVHLLDGLTHDRIEREQYLDFLSNRGFRQVLLCHADLPVSFALNPETLRAFRIASPASPDADPPAAAGQTFVGLDGARHTTDDPIAQAAWLQLIELWPQSATFDELLARAYASLKQAPPAADVVRADALRLAQTLIAAFLNSPRLIELTAYPFRMTLTLSERPVASPWARLHAQQSAKITTLRHERHDLNDLEQFVLLRLDGTQTRDDIVDQLMAGPFADGQLELADGELLTDPARLRSTVRQAVDETLRLFALVPLLVA